MAWLRPMVGVYLNSRARFLEGGEDAVDAGEQEVGSLGELHGKAGVEDVAA